MIKLRQRFLDLSLLDSGYFLNLNADERLFWIFIQLKCDKIGRFEMEGELLFANRMHGLNINLKDFLEKVNSNEERLRDLGKGLWFLTQFIGEQYGRLTPTSPPHKAYIKGLKVSGLWDTFIRENPDLAPFDRVEEAYQPPIATLKEEEEDIDEEKEKEKDKAQGKEFLNATGLKPFNDLTP